MFQIKLQVSAHDLNAVETLLEEWGALSISLENATDTDLFAHTPNEQPLWSHTTLCALFDVLPNMRAMRDQFALRQLNIENLQSEEIKNQNWIETSRAFFTPRSFGNYLWVCPAWSTLPDPLGKNVRIEPGLAFGTGNHPTTALCLEWLARHPPIGKTVIDYGCGSGVLSLAAYKLGARCVYAVDHDPQAIQATHNNIALNPVPKHAIQIVDATKLRDHNAHLIVANILVSALIELANDFAELLMDKGEIVLSGVLTSQRDDVLCAYTRRFNIMDVIEQDDWMLIYGVLK